MTWEELTEVRRLRRELRHTEQSLELIRSTSAQTSRYDAKPLFTPQLKSSVEFDIMRINELERRIEEITTALADAKVRLEKAIIDSVEDVTARALMILRYIDCKHFRDIGFALGYSEAHIYHLHRIICEKIIVNDI